MPLILDSVPSSPAVQTALGVVLLSLLYYTFQYVIRSKTIVGIPVIHLSDEKEGDAQADWLKDAKGVIAKGSKTGKPFQIITRMGPVICLPTRYANEIKNDTRFDFNGAVREQFFDSYKGFEMFNPAHNGNNIVPEVVRTKLTQSLGLITNDLVEEAELASLEVFPPTKEWSTIKIKEENLQLVARLSARAFLGVPMCRDQAWLDISKNYTVDVFQAAQKLREVHPLLRYFAQYWIPECQRIRHEITDARNLIRAEVDSRRIRAEETLARGEKVRKTADAIGWLVEAADKRGDVGTDFAICQIALSVAAIHTTSETLTHSMILLCKHPEALRPLRDEIVSVFSDNGWNKTTLYKLRLMDSFLKEAQRISTLSQVNMMRMVHKNVELSDGTTIPAKSHTMVLSRYDDPTLYPEPEKFKVDRFLNMRSQPGQENGWQMATASPDHLAFGLGTHACPGRFFVTNELKVALVFMLLRYDWELANDNPMIYETETRKIIIPGIQMKYRSREPELDLMSLMEASPEL